MSLRGIRRSIGEWLDRYLLHFTLVMLLAAFVFVFFAPRIVVTIPAGSEGVLWQRFGGTKYSRTYGEGLHVIFPWNEMVSYNVRYQTDTREYSVVDSQGLTFAVQLSTRYRANVETLGQLHSLVGPDYLEVIIVPEIASHIREVISTMTAQDVYSRLRPEIETNMVRRIRHEIDLESRSGKQKVILVYIEDILLRAITLPPIVVTAIEQKVRQYHLVEEWQFRKTREEIEAERLRIEGRGIRNFYDEAGRSLTEPYLRLRGIEAILKLAESPNAKTILIGPGSNVPIILGTETIRPGPLPGAGGPRSEAPPATPAPSVAFSDSKDLPVSPPPAPAAEAAKPPVSAAPSKHGAASESGWLGGIMNRLTKLVVR